MLTVALWMLADPPTVEEVLRNMHRAIRDTRRYREVWECRTDNPSDPVVSYRRWLDGERYRLEFESGGRKVAIAGGDDKQRWVINPPDRTYGTWDGPNPDFAAPYRISAIPDEGSYRIQFDGAYDLGIRANPSFRAISLGPAVMGGNPVRRFDAESRLGARFVKLTIYFDAEVWLANRVSVNGRDAVGKRSWTEFRLKEREFGAKMPETLFRLDPKAIEGFDRMKS